jgi:hypothetical protein
VVKGLFVWQELCEKYPIESSDLTRLKISIIHKLYSNRSTFIRLENKDFVIPV